MVKKFCLIFILLLVATLSLSAKAFGLIGTIEGGASFALPTADYLKMEDGPLFRTSGFYQADLDFLEIQLGEGKNNIAFSVSCSFGANTESLAYRDTILRPYTYNGVGFRAAYTLDDVTSLAFRLRVLDGYFPGSKSYFQIKDYAFIPSFCVLDKKYCGVSLVTPLTCSVKADTVTFRLSLGASLWLGVKEGK